MFHNIVYIINDKIILLCKQIFIMFLSSVLIPFWYFYIYYYFYYI